ncbi:MAG: SufD family Fe-S cluster assembly protein [Verrucomicrobiota bacterium]
MVSKFEPSVTSNRAISSEEMVERFRERQVRRRQELKAPHRKDEGWRFANLKRQPKLNPDIVASSFSVSSLPDGVSLLSLEEAFRRDAQRVDALLKSLDSEMGAGWHLAPALSSESLSAVCFWVEAGTVSREPIVIERNLEGGDVGAFATLLFSEDQSSIAVRETLGGSKDSWVGISAIDAGAASHLEYTLSKDTEEDEFLIHRSHQVGGRDATTRLGLFNYGSGWCRQESSVSMEAPGHSGELFGLNMVGDEGEVDQRTCQVHSSGRCRSDLLIKNTAFDRGKVIFSGLIDVRDGAHFTDSFQSCRNLLLSEEAEVNAMPGLEINADQVRCSHGATSGQIDEEELFYLRARGISLDRAKHLITLGFALDVAGRFSSEGLKELIGEEISINLENREP